MGYKAKNFAFTHLAGSLAVDGLTFAVNTGTGSRFPTLAEGDFTIVALESAEYRELIKVVGISGDTFTIAADGRGYESTTPRAWVAGTVVRCCLTAGMAAHVLAAGSRLDDHEAAANPHPQYVTSEEVVAAVAPAQNTANGALQKSGGTMTGPITLSGDASNALEAVPKQQLDASIAALNVHGQCRLTKSGANLILRPYNGNKLIINGAAQTIPSAGVTLAPPATSATNYYIYAFMNAGTMTLEASATTHATDSTTGVEIKSGDATRTLVGLARTVSSAWVDTATQRLVCSYFNQPRRTVLNSLGSDVNGVGAAWVSLGAGGLVSFVTFDGVVDLKGQATALDANNGALGHLSIAIDSTQQSIQGFAMIGNGIYQNINAFVNQTYAEGYHTAQLYAGAINATFYTGHTGITGTV